MAINYASLLSEIQVDPRGYGYAAAITAGRFGEVANLLNVVRVGISVRKGIVQGFDIINALDKTEFETLTQLQLTRLMVVCSASGGVDTAGDGTRAILGGLFSPGVSRTALIALGNREGSRAEELFGIGATVTFLDVAKAQGRG